MVNWRPPSRARLPGAPWQGPWRSQIQHDPPRSVLVGNRDCGRCPYGTRFRPPGPPLSADRRHRPGTPNIEAEAPVSRAERRFGFAQVTRARPEHAGSATSRTNRSPTTVAYRCSVAATWNHSSGGRPRRRKTQHVTQQSRRLASHSVAPCLTGVANRLLR
jgi:hypothetical protein